MFGRQSLRELIRSNHEEIVRSMDETREFNREILLRNEKVYTGVIAQLEENTAATRANTEGLLKALGRFFEQPRDDSA